MRQVLLVVISTVFAFTSLASDAQDGTFTVMSPVEFLEGSGATSEVMSECGLETRLPEFIKSAAKRGVTVVIAADSLESAGGKVLYLEFSHVLGGGGGAWSGPKTVTVRGSLQENGEVIGSFVGTRYTTGGAFGGFKGTCSLLGRCIKSLGADIAKWLQAPTIDAMLGDA